MLNNKTLTLLLVALCAILVNLVLFGMVKSLDSGSYTETETTDEILKIKQTNTNPTNTLEEIGFYHQVVQRPLFNFDRKPVEVVQEVEEPEEEQFVTSSPKPKPQLTLAGIVLSDGAKIAYVHNNQSPEVQSVKLNDSIDGWKLSELNGNEVTFTSGSRQFSLELIRRGDKEKAMQLQRERDNQQAQRKQRQNSPDESPGSKNNSSASRQSDDPNEMTEEEFDIEAALTGFEEELENE